jgi:cytochrome c oxidase assembly protein subunit 15
MKLNIYQKTALTTVIATLVLILVGGLVRAAGAGLGCPDWPKCFGMWIPPTTLADLPAGYDAELFNPVHTWLEYINRLIGVLIGLLITATFVLSFRYRKIDKHVTIASGVAFILVLFQGWLGGQVVRSGLSAGMITIHMVVAMIIVNTLLYATFRAMSGRLDLKLSAKSRSYLLTWGGWLLGLTLLQLILGTQVREAVDVLKNAADPLPREMWIDSINWIYEVHRTFSWVIVAVAGFMWYKNRSLNLPRNINLLFNIIVKLILLQIVLGVGMEWLAIPGVLQLLHLVSVSLLLCTQFLMILMAGFATIENES